MTAAAAAAAAFTLAGGSVEFPELLQLSRLSPALSVSEIVQLVHIAAAHGSLRELAGTCNSDGSNGSGSDDSRGGGGGGAQWSLVADSFNRAVRRDASASPTAALAAADAGNLVTYIVKVYRAIMNQSTTPAPLSSSASIVHPAIAESRQNHLSTASTKPYEPLPSVPCAESAKHLESLNVIESVQLPDSTLHNDPANTLSANHTPITCVKQEPYEQLASYHPDLHNFGTFDSPIDLANLYVIADRVVATVLDSRTESASSMAIPVKIEPSESLPEVQVKQEPTDTPTIDLPMADLPAMDQLAIRLPAVELQTEMCADEDLTVKSDSDSVSTASNLCSEHDYDDINIGELPSTAVHIPVVTATASTQTDLPDHTDTTDTADTADSAGPNCAMDTADSAVELSIGELEQQTQIQRDLVRSERRRLSQTRTRDSIALKRFARELLTLEHLELSLEHAVLHRKMLAFKRKRAVFEANASTSQQ